MTTDTTDVRRQVADQRRALADLLADLTADQWRRPSLCAGWTVHHVVAHLALPYTSRPTRVLVETVRARGDFDRAADAMARADAARHAPAELVEIVRANVDHPWSPPGGGPAGALSHDVIHSFDMTEALGLPTIVTPERARTVLAAFRPQHLRGFGTDLRSTRAEATDDPLVIGAPAQAATRVVRAPLQELILLLTGRRREA